MQRWIRILAACLAAGTALKAQAFCIKNEIPKTHGIHARVHVYAAGHHQATGRDFSTDVAPGKEGCCHWTNTNCNKTGKAGAPLEADFSLHVPALFRQGNTYRCAGWREGVALRSDGTARFHRGVEGDLKSFYVTTFTPDGKPDQQYRCNVK